MPPRQASLLVRRFCSLPWRAVICMAFAARPALAADAAPPADQSTNAKAAALAAAAVQNAPKPVNKFFQATAEEMDRAMHADSAVAQKEPLQFPKGNGLRILMSGHSFVAPATRTLPALSKAGGFDGHHQRFHTSGGSTGSANAIWLTEFGKFKDKPAEPILLPAIATGQWDVMTWGAYYNDTLECYTPWIDVCLSKNPQMIFFIQDGWPLYPKAVAADDPKLMFSVMETQWELGQKELFRPLFEGLDQRYPGKTHIMPAAGAVIEMVRHYFAGELPGFDCLSEHLGGKRGIYRDGGHLSVTSGMDQIVGYVYFGMLYRQSPERVTGYKPQNVDPTVDRLMRQSAWHAIIHSPFSGITDRDGKGVAD